MNVKEINDEYLDDLEIQFLKQKNKKQKDKIKLKAELESLRKEERELNPSKFQSFLKSTKENLKPVAQYLKEKRETRQRVGLPMQANAQPKTVKNNKLNMLPMFRR